MDNVRDRESKMVSCTGDAQDLNDDFPRPDVLNRPPALDLQERAIAVLASEDGIGLSQSGFPFRRLGAGHRSYFSRVSTF